MQLVRDQVWCDYHGCIHDKTIVPYGFIEHGCSPESWRNVWVGGRKPANRHVEPTDKGTLAYILRRDDSGDQR